MAQLNEAQKILAVVKNGMPFDLGAYIVTINNPAVSGNCFTADVIVEKAGVIVFNDDVRVVDPPLLVPDPSGGIIRPGSTGLNPLTNEEETTPDTRFRNDPVAAIKIIIADTILVLIK